MYIERVPNRNSPPAVLLRSSHWDHGKIRKVTHANLSKLPQPLVDAIALLLRGGTVVGPGSPAVRILDSRPCGHVAALLGGARQLGLLGLGPVSEQQLYDTLDWLARRQPAIEAKLARRLLRERRFDPEQVGDWQLARIESPDYPGERLLVCRNCCISDYFA